MEPSTQTAPLRRLTREHRNRIWRDTSPDTSSNPLCVPGQLLTGDTSASTITKWMSVSHSKGLTTLDRLPPRSHILHLHFNHCFQYLLWRPKYKGCYGPFMSYSNDDKTSNQPLKKCRIWLSHCRSLRNIA